MSANYVDVRNMPYSLKYPHLGFIILIESPTGHQYALSTSDFIREKKSVLHIDKPFRLCQWGTVYTDFVKWHSELWITLVIPLQVVWKKCGLL